MIRQNAASTKSHNRAAVVTMLLRNPMSRAALAKATGLTRASISLITDELITDGILCESESNLSLRNRRSVTLVVSGKRYFVAGVDISRKNCILGICNLRGETIFRSEFEWNQYPTPQEAVRIAAQKLLKMQSGLEAGAVLLAVGITMPGPVNARQGCVLQPVGMDFWFNFPITQEFETYFDCPVWIENNAVARAIGENYYGCGKKYSSFIELTVFQGIGCGIVSGNQIFLAENGISSGIGHSTINAQGQRCACGNIGCLEMYALPERIVASCKCNDVLTWMDIVDHAASVPACMRAVANEASYLVSALIVLVNMFSPQAIILSGELNTKSNLLINMMEQQFCTRLNTGSMVVPKVEYSEMHENVRLLSACSVGIEKTFWEKK